MEKDPPQEERTRAADKRATDARKLAESLEERAEAVHRAAAAAQASVAQFAEMVREHEPDIASKLDVDPERYRRRAASETARADHARQRREDDAARSPGTEDTKDAARPSDQGEKSDGGTGR
jgi:hypothetical protein